MKLGLFRYNLGNIKTRILPGVFEFVAQLNIERGLERRKPQDIQSVQQSFDPHQFNFNKIKPEEILFQIRKQFVPRKRGLNAEFQIQDSALDITCQPAGVPSLQSSSNITDQNCVARNKDKPNSILAVINVSPLEFGHVLFIPEPTLCLPQILTADLIQFGIESIFLSANPCFRVGFNSLGGFASVNHLHLHGFYLNYKLFIETACTEALCPGKSFHALSDFPAPGFLFYTDGKDLQELAHNIHKVTNYLVAQNIAHNLFLTRGSEPGHPVYPVSEGGTRIIIWPRKSGFGAKEETAFNVALCELAGHLPIKNQEDFNNITEASAVTIIQKYLLPKEEFLQLASELVNILTA
ncbi:hypothetical protein NDU88_005296 [Pleurodeles waltl]|uniref:GDP-D-glucose phosphorylase 1 n=2 Tax=Pleurodeles waltl TaxID=8319 RepID=A0AAV7TTV3_PLEWA|nr:hypothetical protein NDU88_005296 [Pleurodeles waltl]